MQIMQIPLFDPLTHMTWKKGDPCTDLDMHINLAQFQPRFWLISYSIYN